MKLPTDLPNAMAYYVGMTNAPLPSLTRAELDVVLMVVAAKSADYRDDGMTQLADLLSGAYDKLLTLWVAAPTSREVRPAGRY